MDREGADDPGGFNNLPETLPARNVARSATFPRGLTFGASAPPIKVGPDGRVPTGSQRLSVDAAPGSRLIPSHHPTAHYSVLAAKPIDRFSNLPR